MHARGRGENVSDETVMERLSRISARKAKRAEDGAVKAIYRRMSPCDLLALANAFEADMKGVSGKPSVHFAAHRLVLIAEVLAETE